MAPITHWPLFEVRMLLKIKICVSLFRAEESREEERGVDAGIWNVGMLVFGMLLKIKTKNYCLEQQSIGG